MGFPIRSVARPFRSKINVRCWGVVPSTDHNFPEDTEYRLRGSDGGVMMISFMFAQEGDPACRESQSSTDRV